MAGVSRYSFGVFAASLFLAGLTAAPAFSQSSTHDVADQMLQTGMDAAIDGDLSKARSIFGNLIATFPRSTAARKAMAEASKLDAAAAKEEDGEQPAAGDGSEALRKIRFRFVSEVGDRVFFAENSAVIGGRARAILEAQARWLKNAQGVDVTIRGRADDGGSPDEALALAQKRAEAVQAKLIEGGVPQSRIKLESLGNTDPVATCRSPLCQSQNRNAESLIGMVNAPDPRDGPVAGGFPETRGADAAGAPGSHLAR